MTGVSIGLLPPDAGCSTFNLIACGSGPEATVDGAAEVRRLMREHLGA